jgi:hypothetical protein
MRNMPAKIKNPKFQITNSKPIFWSLVIIWNLVLGAWNFTPCYAAPCYGTKMPDKKKFFAGVQSHSIIKRYLEEDYGKIRSMQHFLLISYGVFDWLSIDLKVGAGNIKQHPLGSDEVDYSSGFAGGYGFRIRLFDTGTSKMVFGFQHISVHPRKLHLGPVKHTAVLDDWQVSLLVSHRLGKITPYLGAKWSRVDYIHWVEENRKRRMSDLTKDVGLVLGCDIPFNDRVWINLEGQAIDSEALALSLNFSF